MVRLIRRLLLLLAFLPLQRYLSPLLPIWLPLIPIGLAWLVRWWVPEGRSRLLATLAVVPGLPLLSLLLFYLLAITGAAGPWESWLVLAGWQLVPAAGLATLVVFWDLWVEYRPAGRVALVPVLALLLLASFWSQAEFRTDLFGHASWHALYALIMAALMVAHQGLAGRSGQRGLRRAVLPVLVVLLLVSGVSLLVFRSWQGQAVQAGGGLLQPTAFRFDFADYISLEPEIRQSRDLVFLYREERAPADRLLRRYVLSGYDPRRGFYRLDADDEPDPAPPLSIDEAARGLGAPEEPAAPGAELRAVEQEYYVVNFDPDALVAVQEPARVAPLRSWSRSSFNRAYRVASVQATADPASLAAVPWPRDLPVDWTEVYTGGPVPEGVARLAREVTAGAEGYLETVLAVNSYLLNEYYYSLSPGEAVNGSQLEHFLFESRKGYCSYFAFSMALMLRSLDIPARVAVGFFVDPRTGMLGFHPVRGDMAHAWVEVWFPGVGWLEFDPTSSTIAPGEQVSTDYGIDQEQLSSLIEEILAQDGAEAETRRDPVVSGGQLPVAIRRALRALLAGLVLALAALVVWLLRHRRWRRLRAVNPRRAALLLLGRLRRVRSLAAYARRLELERVEQRARFGPSWDEQDTRELEAELEALLRTPGPDPDPPRPGQRAWPAALRAAVHRQVGTLNRRLLRTLPPRVRRRDLREPAGRWTAVMLLVGLSLAVPDGLPPLAAQLPDGTDGPGRSTERALPAADAEDLLREARAAVDGENYEEAIAQLRAGQERFPDDYRFPLEEGDLYFDQRLYGPARDAYRRALARGAPDFSTRYMLTRSLTRLNDDEAAIGLLEALLREYPGDVGVVGDLAWLYFKVHRLEEARELLERTLEEEGTDRDLLMTLATVYSGLWDYEAALRHYRQAIQLAALASDRPFQSVAYYNLSILHANFYRYEEAVEAAENSLTMAERPSGYMIRAELSEMRLDVETAAADYHRAGVLDEITPLADLSIARLWADAGYPDRALARIERILEEDERTWMYNFGTNPERYQLQLYSAQADAWEAQASVLRLQRSGTAGQRLLQWFSASRARVLSWYYRGLERFQRRRVADTYDEQGRELLAAWNRMQAAENWRPIAMRHARRARALEVPFNPAAEPDYELFAAGVAGDARRLSELAATLDQPWRRGDRVRALRGVYRERPRDPEGLRAGARAWALAPGTLLVNGLRIPIALAESGRSPHGSWRTRRVLARMGLRIDERSPLQLELEWQAGQLAYRVWDRESGLELRRGDVRYGAGDKRAPLRALETMAVTLGRAGEQVLGPGEQTAMQTGSAEAADGG